MHSRAIWSNEMLGVVNKLAISSRIHALYSDYGSESYVKERGRDGSSHSSANAIALALFRADSAK